MQVTDISERRAGHGAFTLIELMIVVAIVGILIGGVFQLLSTAGTMNKKAETTAHLQRLQNALSGFYAEYGTYPPVAQYTSPDPWGSGLEDDFENDLSDISSEEGFARACSFAARSQPVAFEYPNVQGMDYFINQKYNEFNLVSANTLLAQTAASTPKHEWKDIKMFKFGLLSFVLPRIEQVGFTGLDAPNEKFEPDLRFYESKQWKKNNPVSNVNETRRALQSQQIIENRAAARWMPNLEKMVKHGKYILGVDTCEKDTPSGEGLRTHEVYQNKKLVDVKGYSRDGNDYVLSYVTIRDDYDNEFYYYSPPPHQSYRLWSAGKDGRTFPPWIPLENLSSKEREWAAKWLKDDIVRFDQ